MLRTREDLIVDIDNNKATYYLFSEKSLVEENLINLNELANKLNKYNISILEGGDEIKNEILQYPDIDIKYYKDFIKKELLKRENKDILVGSRQLTEDYILISSIPKEVIVEYGNLFNKKIKLVTTRLDFLLNRYNLYKDMALINIYRNSSEILLNIKGNMELLSLDEGWESNHRLLELSIEDIIVDYNLDSLSWFDLYSIKKIDFLDKIGLNEIEVRKISFLDVFQEVF